MSIKKPIAFCTNISDEYFDSMGARKLIASAKYFHPEIPFHVFGTKEVSELGMPPEILMPFILGKLIDEYEMVVRFDADSMITGPLDELINAKGFDIIGVRNNNDFGMAGKDDPIAQFNIGVERYLNAGLVATTSRKFVDEWADACLSFGLALPFGEQTVLNGLTRKYTTHIVDGIDTQVYYGVSCLSGTETHWDSWKEIKVIDGDLVLNEKKVKVLHHAGGFKPDKLGFYMFNEETRKRLIEIVGY